MFSAQGRASGGLAVAMMLVLCAGCDGSPPAERTGLTNGASGQATGHQAPAVDRQEPGSENHAPNLGGGAHGKLGYRPGCLFLEGNDGGTGLVIPSYAVFDGKRLVGRVRKPTGEPIVFEVGGFANISGRLIDNPRDGRYSCATKSVLITAYL